MQHELARQHGRMQGPNDQDLPVRGHSVDDGMLADEVAKVGWDLMQGFEVHDCKGPLGDATRRPTPDAELPALSAGVVGMAGAKPENASMPCRRVHWSSAAAGACHGRDHAELRSGANSPTRGSAARRLVFGGSGRERASSWELVQSPIGR